jgi:hypothetical protein
LSSRLTRHQNKKAPSTSENASGGLEDMALKAITEKYQAGMDWEYDFQVFIT